VSRNRENRVKIGQNPQKRLETRLRNGQDQYGRNSTHGVDIFDHHGVPALLVHPWLHTYWAPRAGVPWRLKMAVKWQYGLNSDRAVIMHETAQKRLRPAPVVSAGCPGM
jgi:hypothetical protein